MDVPVEAQSLSALQYLLANPPQYPRNPTHEVRKPLVLYIVRVPGSKDVFLTPLKPPTKASISLEAIQSSLYYLHVESPDDEVLRRSIDHEKENFKASDVLPQIQRKPVPSLRTMETVNVGKQARSAVHTDTIASKASVVRESIHRLGSTDSASSGPLPRKPLGPRSPSHLQSPSVADQKTDTRLDFETTDIKHLSKSEGLHRDTYNGTGPAHALDVGTIPPVSDPYHRPSLGPGRSQQSPIRRVDSGSPTKSHRMLAKITLIRRDPASGAQWNVGTITGLDTLSESSLKPFAVELTTPGYSKFLGQEDLSPRREINTTDPAAIKQLMMAATSSQKSTVAATVSRPDENFMRTVAFRQQPQPICKQPTRLQNRTNSGESFMNYPIQNNRPPRNIFSFTSPWQGLCTFMNGIDGRSLKCRHSLSSAGLSPVEDEASTANLAELRFNLPWAAVGARERGRDSGKSPSSNEFEADTLPISKLLTDRPNGSRDAVRRSFQHIKSMSRDFRDTHLRSSPNDYLIGNEEFSRASSERAHGSALGLLPQRHQNLPSSAADAEQQPDPDRLSLRLGREKAGGGFRGHSAKLGKLILENEGLKMGDLVVAACMGVWWQHYETGCL